MKYLSYNNSIVPVEVDRQLCIAFKSVSSGIRYQKSVDIDTTIPFYLILKIDYTTFLNSKGIDTQVSVFDYYKQSIERLFLDLVASIATPKQLKIYPTDIDKFTRVFNIVDLAKLSKGVLTYDTELQVLSHYVKDTKLQWNEVYLPVMSLNNSSNIFSLIANRLAPKFSEQDILDIYLAIKEGIQETCFQAASIGLTSYNIQLPGLCTFKVYPKSSGLYMNPIHLLSDLDKAISPINYEYEIEIDPILKNTLEAQMVSADVMQSVIKGLPVMGSDKALRTLEKLRQILVTNPNMVYLKTFEELMLEVSRYLPEDNYEQLNIVDFGENEALKKAYVMNNRMYASTRAYVLALLYYRDTCSKVLKDPTIENDRFQEIKKELSAISKYVKAKSYISNEDKLELNDEVLDMLPWLEKFKANVTDIVEDKRLNKIPVNKQKIAYTSKRKV